MSGSHSTLDSGAGLLSPHLRHETPGMTADIQPITARGYRDSPDLQSTANHQRMRMCSPRPRSPGCSGQCASSLRRERKLYKTQLWSE